MSSEVTSSSADASPSMGDVAISPYATIVVKSPIPMTLELRSSNYTKWSSFFLASCHVWQVRAAQAH